MSARASLLSRELLEFRDAVGIHLGMGKREFARDNYSRAQFAAVKAQVHSSKTRKDRKSGPEISLDAVAD